MLIVANAEEDSARSNNNAASGCGNKPEDLVHHRILLDAAAEHILKFLLNICI